ncbi:MAG: 6-phosphofructokinase [Bacteroidales bacterium]|nr:6-phosphofructokinase [Bacteroidales bacterium]
MKIGILTGGGDVAPLNAIIQSAIGECNRKGIEIIGYLKGWDGLLSDRKIQLNNHPVNGDIGGTILKSSRVNLKTVAQGGEKVLQQLNADKLDGLIVLGGEDTLSNALLIKDYPKVLISKTIDNDVGFYKDKKFFNHFSLGYPTAAEKISSFVSLSEGLRTTAISHERIIIVESMGMHAGWLALASSQGNPDFIIIPEFPLDFEYFKKRVEHRFRDKNNVIIVISEGARWTGGEYISADENEKDSFGHPRFKGTAEKLAELLKDALKGKFDTRNINAVNPSYLYRSGRPNTIDKKIGFEMGAMAVNHLLQEKTTVFLFTELERGPVFQIRKFDFNELHDIEEFHRFVDDTLYDPDNYAVTDFGKDYFSTFVPSLT